LAAPTTHLVVPSGDKRTIKVIFALLHGAFLVVPDFFAAALDGVWPSESDYAVSGRDWAPRHERQEVMKGHLVFIHPGIIEPAPLVLRQIVELAGGAISESQGASTTILSDRSVPKERGKPQLSTPELFDFIEGAKRLEVSKK